MIRVVESRQMTARTALNVSSEQYSPSISLVTRTARKVTRKTPDATTAFLPTTSTFLSARSAIADGIAARTTRRRAASARPGKNTGVRATDATRALRASIVPFPTATASAAIVTQASTRVQGLAFARIALQARSNALAANRTATRAVAMDTMHFRRGKASAWSRCNRACRFSLLLIATKHSLFIPSFFILPYLTLPYLTLPGRLRAVRTPEIAKIGINVRGASTSSTAGVTTAREGEPTLL
jgi:hypothetical protein